MLLLLLGRKILFLVRLIDKKIYTMINQTLIIFSDGSSEFEFFLINSSQFNFKILNKDLKYNQKKKMTKFNGLKSTTLYRKKYLG